jgi:hypothetical protein
MKTVITGAAVAGVAISLAGLAHAQTQVRDATYRGTLVCDKLPFFETAAREAIEVKIKGQSVTYTHIVRERNELSFELGTGTLDGDKLTLKGDWAGEAERYQATYSGTFVRRWAKLTGTQTWQHEGKTHTRKCEGAIKRPFAVFLPGEGPPEEKK